MKKKRRGGGFGKSSDQHKIPVGPIDITSLPEVMRPPFEEFLRKYPDTKFSYNAKGQIVADSELARKEHKREA